MNTAEQLLALFKQIELHVDEGERLLQDDLLQGSRLCLQIKCDLPAIINNSYNDLSLPREIVIRLTVDVLSRLADPSDLNDFAGAIALLPPLKAIKDIGYSEEFKRLVIVEQRVRDPLIDSRTPLNEFLSELCKYLDRDKCKDKKPVTRRIQGFNPRPDDEGSK